MERHPVFKLCWRHWPKALFCDQPLRQSLECLADDAALIRRQRCALYVVAKDVGSGSPHVGVFEPRGRWDGRLLDHVMASHAIPWIFPPVRLAQGEHESLFIDGGYGDISEAALENFRDCSQVWIVSLPRADARHGPSGPLRRLHHRIQRSLHGQMRRAARHMASWPRPPEIRWIVPSRPWNQFVLDFRPEPCRSWYQSGVDDGAAFLASAPLGSLEREPADRRTTLTSS
jgi:predicted acylesterase/phospholipase RssA